MTVDFVDPSNSVDSKVRRTKTGRPYIKQPGGKEVTYTRCSTFAKELEETYTLGLWQQRMVALGLSQRPDLLLAVAAHRDDRDKLNEICDEAKEAAGAHAKANIGTALHAFTEQYDLLDADDGDGIVALLDRVPAAYRPDIDAYIEATNDFDVVSVETFGVVDSIKVAGTWDRILNDGGRNLIGDIKSGSIDFNMGEIAMQLAIYAHAKRYDPVTGERFDLVDIDLEHAVIIHLPQGEGRCELVDVNIAAGWEAVQLALEVKKWRKRGKDLGKPFDRARHWLAVAVEQTASIAELAKLWCDNKGEWNHTLTALAASHKHRLESQAIGTTSQTERQVSE